MAGFAGAFDAVATPDQLEYLAEKVIPPSLAGLRDHRVRRFVRQQVADSFGTTGVDSVIMHGSTPAQLAPVLAAYGAVRRPDQPVLPANPGRMA